MMDRSGFPPLSWRSLAVALAGVAILAAAVAAVGLATGPAQTGEAALRTPAPAGAAANRHLDRADTPSALADFGEGTAVRLLSDLGIFALERGPARDVQVAGTQRGMVVRAMPTASAPSVAESTDGRVARPDELPESVYTLTAVDDHLPPGQHDGAPESATELRDEERPTWLAALIECLREWLERLQGS